MTRQAGLEQAELDAHPDRRRETDDTRGMGGGDALGYGIERMVTGLQSSPHSERGVAARLRYLTTSEAGYAAMERAGTSVTAPHPVRVAGRAP